MKVLITGASGLLGRCLADQLKRDHEVYILLRNNDIQHDFSDCHIIIQDLSDLNTSQLPEGLEAIYYLAQSRQFREFPQGALDVLKVNVDAPVILADWALNNGVKNFFYTSTGGVYTDPDIPVKELFDIIANKTQGFYFNSKLAAEMLLKNYASEFESFALLRPFFIYGPGQNKDMLIPRLIGRVSAQESVYLDGEEGLEINPIYVEDAAIAFARLLDLAGSHIINIAGPEVISLKEICNIIGKAICQKPVLECKDTKASRLIADISEMKSKLHTPSVTFAEGVLNLIHSMGL